jgi:hypothetical protein
MRIFKLHVLQLGSDCTKIAWGRSRIKFGQKLYIFMLDFDAKGPKSKDFPVESKIPPLLGLHLRLEIGTSARPNGRNFARGIRFRGLKLTTRRGNAIFFNFSACGGLCSYPPFFSFILSSRKWVPCGSLLDPLELQATGTPFREKNVTS